MLHPLLQVTQVGEKEHGHDLYLLCPPGAEAAMAHPTSFTCLERTWNLGFPRHTSCPSPVRKHSVLVTAQNSTKWKHVERLLFCFIGLKINGHSTWFRLKVPAMLRTAHCLILVLRQDKNTSLLSQSAPIMPHAWCSCHRKWSRLNISSLTSFFCLNSLPNCLYLPNSCSFHKTHLQSPL